MCQGKKKFCKNVRDMSWNFTFQSDEFIKFPAPILSGNLNLPQEIWSILNV